MTNKELTEIRKKLSLTKKELAEKIGTTAMMLGRYEKGSREIPEELAEKVKALITPSNSQTEENMVSEFVKNLRSSLNLSRSAFGKMIGVSGSAVVNYETGKSQPREGVLEKIKALQAEATAIEEAMSAPAEEKAADSMVVEEKISVDENPAPADVMEASSTDKKTVSIVIESKMGGTITTEEVLSRLPDGVDTVYIKPEENAAYWVKGEESGVVNLW